MEVVEVVLEMPRMVVLDMAEEAMVMGMAAEAAEVVITVAAVARLMPEEEEVLSWVISLIPKRKEVFRVAMVW